MRHKSHEGGLCSMLGVIFSSFVALSEGGGVDKGTACLEGTVGDAERAGEPETVRLRAGLGLAGSGGFSRMGRGEVAETWAAESTPKEDRMSSGSSRPRLSESPMASSDI